MAEDQDDSQKTELQNILHQLLSESLNFVLLVPFDDYKSKIYGRIPKSWVKHILPFVDVPKRYKPYIDDQGLLVTLTIEKEPHRIYEELTVYVMEQIERLYDDGVMIIRDQDLIKSWALEAINEKENLYYPVWVDRRITDHYSGPVGFLRSRLQGDKTLSIDVGMSLSIRHNISKLFRCVFVGNHVRFKVTDIADARMKLTKIPIAVSKMYGNVIAISVINLSQANKYVEILKTTNPDVDTAIYKDEKGFVISFVADHNSDSDYEQKSAIMSYIEELSATKKSK